MSERFTPIGGMFQGVRGSTVRGGTDDKANNLVMLDENGLLDETTFPPSVREAASLSDALDDEIAERKNADQVLQSSVENAASSIVSERLERASADNALQEQISSEASERISAVQGLDSRVLALEDWKAPTEQALSNAIGDIGDLQSGETNIDGRLVALTNVVNTISQSSIPGIESNVSSLSTAVATLQTTVNNLVAGSSNIQPQLDAINESISGIRTAISTLSESVTANFSVVNGKIDGINARIADLDRRVTILEENQDPSNL